MNFKSVERHERHALINIRSFCKPKGYATHIHTHSQTHSHTLHFPALVSEILTLSWQRYQNHFKSIKWWSCGGGAEGI